MTRPFPVDKELKGDNFVRGAARIMSSKLIWPTQLGDIMELRPGPDQYDAKEGWKDHGATKTGFSYEENYTIRTNIAELYVPENALDGQHILVAAMMKPNKSIVCYVFTEPTIEYTVPKEERKKMGESTSSPFIFGYDDTYSFVTKLREDQ